MYKKIGILVLVLFTAFALQSKGCTFVKKKNQVPSIEKMQTNEKNHTDKNETPTFAPINEVNGNKIWVGTFQLIWNDLTDDIIKAPVEFVGYNSELADALNKKGFKEEDISENSYYKTYGYMTNALKSEIEKNLKQKLNEKSDILNSLEWNPANFLLYAMLKKDFEYLTEFRILSNADFMGEKVKFFGFNLDDRKELHNNAEVLFYNSKDEYAVKLFTKEGEEVILYRTNDKKSLEDFYENLKEKSANYNGSIRLSNNDTLKVPFIKFNKMFYYNEFAGRQIKNSDFIITEAIQTVKFKMDNKGGSLKSEAVMQMATTALPSKPPEIRHFDFDKPFVLFLKEKDKNVPYFIVHFVNADLFEKP